MNDNSESEILATVAFFCSDEMAKKHLQNNLYFGWTGFIINLPPQFK